MSRYCQFTLNKYARGIFWKPQSIHSTSSTLWGIHDSPPIILTIITTIEVCCYTHETDLTSEVLQLFADVTHYSFLLRIESWLFQIFHLRCHLQSVWVGKKQHNYWSIWAWFNCSVLDSKAIKTATHTEWAIWWMLQQRKQTMTTLKTPLYLIHTHFNCLAWIQMSFITVSQWCES